MSKRIDCTIILLTRRYLYRADFAGKTASRLLHWTKQARVDGGTFSHALHDALELRKSVGRKTLIFDTSIWTQVISVPRMSVADLEPRELNDVLKYEVETLSGVDAESAILGTTEVQPQEAGIASEDRAFWVNVTDQATWGTATEALRSHGARWIGLAHPGGFVVEPTTVSSAGTEAQVERWDDLLVLLRRGELAAIASPSGHWLGEFGWDSMDRAAEAHWLVEAPDDLPEIEGPKSGEPAAVESSAGSGDGKQAGRWILERDSDAKLWLQRAANRVVAGEWEALPVIRPLKHEGERAGLGVFPKVAAAFIAALLCYAHWVWLDDRVLRIHQKIEERRKPAAEKKKFDAELAEVLEQRTELKSDVETTKLQLKKVEFLFKEQTDRLAVLLDMLSEARTPDLIFKQIVPHEQGMEIAGLSLNGNSAPMAAEWLRSRAEPLGWKIHAAKQTGLKKMSNGGPWEFSILFEDVGPPGLISQPVSDEKPPPTSQTSYDDSG